MELQVPISELQKHKIFIAVPMFGGQCMGSFTKSCLDLQRVCTGYGIQIQFSFLFNESLITRARSYLAHEFLESDSTHLMFIDADIDFNPMDMIALLAMDKPVVGGPYPKKTLAWENMYDAVKYGYVPDNDRGRMADFAGDFVFNAVPGTKEIRLDQPVEVLETGTGFMLIKREVFAQFKVAYPQYEYTPDHNRSASFNGSKKIFLFFQAEIDHKSNRYLSEDYRFCQLVREMGSSVWLCPWMQLKHHGSYIYSGSIPAMATVINHRASIGAPQPNVAMTDGSKMAESVLTIRDYNLLSEDQKAAIMTRILGNASEEVKLRVSEKFPEILKQWVATSSTSDFEVKFRDWLVGKE